MMLLVSANLLAYDHSNFLKDSEDTDRYINDVATVDLMKLSYKDKVYDYTPISVVKSENGSIKVIYAKYKQGNNLMSVSAIFVQSESEFKKNVTDKVTDISIEEVMDAIDAENTKSGYEWEGD